MRSFARLLIALFLLSTQSIAQDVAAFQQAFTGGMAALTAGRVDEGIAAFKKCLEILPEDASCAYNIGCGYSKKGEKDTAFEWLDKAGNWGFGTLDDANGNSTLAFCKTDADLKPLHDDPRWAKYVEKLTAQRKPFDEIRGSAVYIPESLKAAAEFPLLVVLHDKGKTKNSIVEGRWKKIADELGCALIAPSGSLPVKPLDPSAGMAWFTAIYPITAAANERPVVDAVATFQKTHKLVADRVFIAGEGMGATVAFNIATARRSPYRGVLIVDGNVEAGLAAPKVAGAVKAGLRVHAIINKTTLSAVAGKDAQPLVDDLTKNLSDWKLIHKVETFQWKEGEADPSEALALAALKSFQVPAAAPVEAGTGK